MSNMTQEQSEEVRRIADLHSRKQTALALEESVKALERVVDKNSDYYRELAILCVMLANSLARSTFSPNTLRRAILTAFIQVNKSFPVSDKSEEASEKGDAWETVYGSTSAQMEIVKHLARLMEIVFMVTHNPEYHSLAMSYLSILEAQSDPTKDNRALMIQRIQKSSPEEAEQALEDFIRHYGPESEAQQVQDTIFLVGIYLGRTIRTRNFSKLRRPLSLLTQIWSEHPEEHRYLLSHVPEHILPRELLIRQRIRLLMLGRKLGPELIEQLSIHRKNKYIGTGNHQFAEVDDQQLAA